jgi:hypothetical protein
VAKNEITDEWEKQRHLHQQELNKELVTTLSARLRALDEMTELSSEQELERAEVLRQVMKLKKAA